MCLTREEAIEAADSALTGQASARTATILRVMYHKAEDENDLLRKADSLNTVAYSIQQLRGDTLDTGLKDCEEENEHLRGGRRAERIVGAVILVLILILGFK